MHATRPSIDSRRPKTPSTTLKARNPTRPVSTAATNRDADFGLTARRTRSAMRLPMAPRPMKPRFAMALQDPQERHQIALLRIGQLRLHWKGAPERRAM